MSVFNYYYSGKVKLGKIFVSNTNWSCSITFTINALVSVRVLSSSLIMYLAKYVPSLIRVRGCIAWNPVQFFPVDGCCPPMWYNSSVVGEYHTWHCCVLESMSLFSLAKPHP